MIVTNLPTLKINKLTKEQYDRELAAGNINENELYLTKTDTTGDVVSIKNGGTGATTAAGALTNLGAADLGANTYSGTQTVNDSGSAGLGFAVKRTIDSILYGGALYVNNDGKTIIKNSVDDEAKNYILLGPDTTYSNKPLNINGGATFSGNITVENSGSGSQSRVISKNSKNQEIRLYMADTTDSGSTDTCGLYYNDANDADASKAVIRFNTSTGVIDRLAGITMDYDSSTKTLSINWMQ